MTTVVVCVRNARIAMLLSPVERAPGNTFLASDGHEKNSSREHSANFWRCKKIVSIYNFCFYSTLKYTSLWIRHRNLKSLAVTEVANEASEFVG